MTKTPSQKRRRQAQRAGSRRNNRQVSLKSLKASNKALRNFLGAKPKPQRRRQQSRSNGGLFREIGSRVGGFIGMPKLGGMLGSGIGKIFGSGDYVVTAPGMIRSNSLAGTTPPQFGNDTGSTRIRHREFISDVNSSLLFSLTSFPLNPGMADLFPWLSNIAKNYEQYRIHGLCIEFKSTSAWAVASTNTSLGVVGCVTQYDASDADFTTKQQAENYQGVQNTSPAHSILHFVECARGSNPLDRLYVRTTALDANQDIKMYDLGKFSLFTIGSQAVSTIGELWVSYDVELSKPKLPNSSSTAETRMEYYFMQGITGATGWFGAGTSVLGPVRSRFGSNFNQSNDRWTFPYRYFPKGKYLFCLNWTKTAGFVGSATQPTFSMTGCVGVNAFVNKSVVSCKAGPGPSDLDIMYSFVIEVQDYYVNGIATNPYITCSGTNWGPDVYSLDAFILPLNSDFQTLPTSTLSLENKYEELLQMFRTLQNKFHEQNDNINYLLDVVPEEQEEDTEEILEISRSEMAERDEGR